MLLNLLCFYLRRKRGFYLTVIAITGSHTHTKNLKAGIISIDISHYKESWKSKRCHHLKKDRLFE